MIAFFNLSITFVLLTFMYMHIDAAAHYATLIFSSLFFKFSEVRKTASYAEVVYLSWVIILIMMTVQRSN